MAALATIIAIGLGIALLRADETAKKQAATIAYLRAEQAKIGELSDQSRRKLASEVARLEQELQSAQQAQLELTEQAFEYENEIDFLHYELETAEDIVTEAAKPAETPTSPYPAYLALKRAVTNGQPYHAEWEALKAFNLPLEAPTKDTLEAHASGVASLVELKEQLRVAYDEAHKVTPDDSILSRLGNVISIRKLDKDSAALREMVMSGDIKSAAEHVRANNAYEDWLEVYDTRREVLMALDALEQQLAGQHG